MSLAQASRTAHHCGTVEVIPNLYEKDKNHHDLLIGSLGWSLCKLNMHSKKTRYPTEVQRVAYPTKGLTSAERGFFAIHSFLFIKLKLGLFRNLS